MGFDVIQNTRPGHRACSSAAVTFRFFWGCNELCSVLMWLWNRYVPLMTCMLCITDKQFGSGDERDPQETKTRELTGISCILDVTGISRKWVSALYWFRVVCVRLGLWSPPHGIGMCSWLLCFLSYGVVFINKQLPCKPQIKPCVPSPVFGANLQVHSCVWKILHCLHFKPFPHKRLLCTSKVHLGADKLNTISSQPSTSGLVSGASKESRLQI